MTKEHLSTLIQIVREGKCNHNMCSKCPFKMKYYATRIMHGNTGVMTTCSIRAEYTAFQAALRSDAHHNAYLVEYAQFIIQQYTQEHPEVYEYLLSELL